MQHVGPILIFCSVDDELAPCAIVQNFAQCLLELGGDVNLVKWKSSPHVGMLFNHFFGSNNSFDMGLDCYLLFYMHLTIFIILHAWLECSTRFGRCLFCPIYCLFIPCAIRKCAGKKYEDKNNFHYLASSYKINKS
jgi:hypothetical protein